MLLRMLPQPAGQQRRQRQEDPGLGHVGTGLKARGYRPALAQRREQAAAHSVGGHAQRSLRIGLTALALGA